MANLGVTYVDYIERTECIGNSLAKINDNFSNLDAKVLELESTTSGLNGLQGIIKGLGNGTFEVADPMFDYYVPGETMYSDLTITGNFNSGGSITIGGDKKDLLVTRGNVGCINLNATGTGSFGGTITTPANLSVQGIATIAGNITGGSLTINGAATVASDLTVTGEIKAQTTINVTSKITSPDFTATPNTGVVVTPTLTVNKQINADGANVVSNFFTTNAQTAFIQTLSAYDGVFLGSRIRADVGTITGLTGTTARITNLSATDASFLRTWSTTINNFDFIGNDMQLNDRFVEGVLKPGKITTNIISTNSLVVLNNVEAANGIFDDTCNAVNSMGSKLINGTEKVYGPLGEFTTVKGTGSVEGPSITSTGNVSGKTITATGAGEAEGIVSATRRVSAPYIDATGTSGDMYGIRTRKLRITTAGDSDFLTIDSVNNNISSTANSLSLNFSGSTTTLKVLGTNSSVESTQIKGGTVSSSSTITASGDIIAYATSDKRLKKNITQISNSLEKVSKLNGVDFNWDTELQSVHEGADTGVIAQEVEEVMPTAVTTRENGYKAVKYDRLIPLLIEAVKELKEQNVALKEEIEALKAK